MAPLKFVLAVLIVVLLISLPVSAQPPNLRPWDKSIFCPNCNSTRVAYILYGEPYLDENLKRALDHHKVVLGGCLITSESKRWECWACGHSWGSVKASAPGAGNLP